MGALKGMEMKRVKRALAGWVLAVGAMVPGLGSAAITYFHNDITGSPVVATNESGQVVWRESYRPYGERTVNAPAALPNKVWFTSRRQDLETGLVYMGARYYDPVAGRFISKDPVGFEENNLHTFNRYAYANNNPYKYVDPDGRMPALVYPIAVGLAPEAVTGITTAIVGGALGLYNIFSDKADAGAAATGAKDAPATGQEESGGNKGASGGARAGKPFTPKGKAEIDAENADRNGGANVCETCGQQVVPGERSVKGVRPPGNERQRDHIVPQSKGGDGSPSNGQVLCRDCNLSKGDRLP